ncbi:hypothetical protein DNU06_13480 [Putridiphycobacter roseus]|uniref:Uncharacterized protein n=1 Tax=Putridiphycobacter roseus TaxID=2219161 RepID=A0A2W1MW41_9FLAO|nr:hypothetical protein [Putridiphycobacter roseus]PZE16319.1 hypothetical protein DNU06_13480 [Putridiphycobacter roseus]
MWQSFKILFLFFFLSFTGFSQVKSVIEGNEFARSKAESFNGFVGEDQSALYTIDYIYSNKKKKELITRKFYKSDLTLIKETDIYTNPNENYYVDPYEVLLVQNKIYLFSIFTHIKEQTTSLGLFIYSEDLTLQSFSIVDSIAKYDQTNIVFSVSNDQQSILMAQNHPHNINNKEVVDLTNFDLTGNVLWQKELISLNAVSRINIEKIQLANQNEVYILCNYGFNNNRNPNVDDIKLLTNKYTLWVYNNELNFLKEIDLRLKQKWLNGIALNIKSNGHLSIAGFANSTRDHAIDAFFNLELDENYEIVQNNYKKLSDSELKSFLPKGSKDSQLEDYHLRKIVMLNDGSFYMVAEHFYTYIDRVYDPRTNTTSTTEHFNYETILVAYFNAAGEFIWLKRIPKIQNSTNDRGYYSSFASFKYQNDLYLFYNDFEKNVEIPIEDTENIKPLFNGRRNALTYVKIQNNGTAIRKHVNTDGNYLLYAKKSLQINEENMYLLLELGRKAKIIGLTF